MLYKHNWNGFLDKEFVHKWLFFSLISDIILLLVSIATYFLQEYTIKPLNNYVYAILTFISLFFENIMSTIIFFMFIKKYKYKSLETRKEKFIYIFLLTTTILPVLNQLFLVIYCKNLDEDRFDCQNQNDEKVNPVKTFIICELILYSIIIASLSTYVTIYFTENEIIRIFAERIVRTFIELCFLILCINKLVRIKIIKIKTNQPKLDKKLILVAIFTFWIPLIGSIVWTIVLFKKNKMINSLKANNKIITNENNNSKKT